MTAFLADADQQITATSGSVTGLSGDFTVVPGPLYELVVDVPGLDGDPVDQTAGDDFDVNVAAVDEWENLRTDESGEVTLSGLGEALDGTDPEYGNR